MHSHAAAHTLLSWHAVHIMCTGRDPFQDMAAPMIILAKARQLGNSKRRGVDLNNGTWVFVPSVAAACGDVAALGQYANLTCKLLSCCCPMQVRASSQPAAARLPHMEGAPSELQQLVWDCTAHNRGERPTAGQVAKRLEGLLATF